jgi:hypothetical protein
MKTDLSHSDDELSTWPDVELQPEPLGGPTAMAFDLDLQKLTESLRDTGTTPDTMSQPTRAKGVSEEKDPDRDPEAASAFVLQAADATATAALRPHMTRSPWWDSPTKLGTDRIEQWLQEVDQEPSSYKGGGKIKKNSRKKKKSKKRKSKKRKSKKRKSKKKYGGSGDEPDFLSFPNQYQTPMGKMETCHVTIDDIGSHSRDATWYPQDYLLAVITRGRYHDQPDIDEIIDNNRVNCVINEVHLRQVRIGSWPVPHKPGGTKWDPDIDLMPGSKYMYAIPVCEEGMWPSLYYSKSQDKMKCYASSEMDVLYHTHPVRYEIDPNAESPPKYQHRNKIKYRPFHHNCLVNDRPVVMAGEIEVSEDSEGKKYTISNGSGHYKPQWTPASEQLIRDYYFNRKNVDTTTPDVMVDTSKIDIAMRHPHRRPRS